MTTSVELLERIAHLRARLAPMPHEPSTLTDHFTNTAGALGEAIKSLHPHEGAAQPKTLTAQARRLLQEAQELVQEQRRLQSVATAPTLIPYHSQTTSLIEAALKTVQNFPNAAEEQVRQCQPVEAILRAARERCQHLSRIATEHQSWQDRRAELARRLNDIASGRVVDPSWFIQCAEELLELARRGNGIRFFVSAADTIAQRVAGHGLVVAQVLARLVSHDYEWAAKPHVPVATALIMDVGMLGIRPELYGKTTPLTIEERREVEYHCERGQQLIRVVFPESELTALAIGMHHERPNGTGYPNGHVADDILGLAKLLAVADVYAALRSDRPHRPAWEAREALAQVLLTAEQGELDREYAELVTHLTFYPVGTVVELTDGRIAVSIATHPPRLNHRVASKPVVAILTDAYGIALPRPEHLDLACETGCGIERSLSTSEITRLLSSQFPEYTC